MGTESQVAWAAGLFEGEGCIAFHSYKLKDGSQRPRLVLKMTDEDVIRSFHEIVGHGTVRLDTWGHRTRGEKVVYEWQAGSQKDVAAVLSLLTPWFHGRRRAKAEEALAALLPPAILE